LARLTEFSKGQRPMIEITPREYFLIQVIILLAGLLLAK